MKNQRGTLLVALIIVLGVSGFVLSTGDGQSGSGSTSQKATRDSIRSRFVLPKLFSFKQYQECFNKHYETVMETVMRANIYLARSFRAFISSLAYKHGRSSMYLSINPMSDWTQTEFDKILSHNKKGFLSDAGQLREQSSPTIQGSLADIRGALEEANEHKDSELPFAEKPGASSACGASDEVIVKEHGSIEPILGLQEPNPVTPAVISSLSGPLMDPLDPATIYLTLYSSTIDTVYRRWSVNFAAVVAMRLPH